MREGVSEVKEFAHVKFTPCFSWYASGTRRPFESCARRRRLRQLIVEPVAGRLNWFDNGAAKCRDELRRASKSGSVVADNPRATER